MSFPAVRYACCRVDSWYMHRRFVGSVVVRGDSGGNIARKHGTPARGSESVDKGVRKRGISPQIFMEQPRWKYIVRGTRTYRRAPAHIFFYRCEPYISAGIESSVLVYAEKRSRDKLCFQHLLILVCDITHWHTYLSLMWKTMRKPFPTHERRKIGVTL